MSQGHQGSYRYPMIVVKRGRGRTRRTTSTTASRWLLAQHLGRPLRRGEEAMHAICDNSRCLNIVHLKVGTRLENERHKWAVGWGVLPPRYEARGEKNGQSKLTAAKVRAIRRAARHMSQRALAKKFRVTAQNVSLVVTGRAWKHVRMAA